VLEACGYELQPAITGAAVQGQAIFDRHDLPGAVLDVHWRIASPIVAADLFDFSQLWDGAERVARLGRSARAPRRLDALAIAAVHLVAHHRNERALLWLYDLHLLVSTLQDAEIAVVARRARERKMATILAAAVERSDRCFPTAAGSSLLDRLSPDATEPSAALVDIRRPSQQALMDLRALAGWRARGAYLADHLFPPAAYMRRRYAPESRAPLPWLYLSRMFCGARKWLRDTNAN
jgi:hypothetical protein